MITENVYEIRGANDLFQAIELLEAGSWPTDKKIKFIEWPIYEITIRGEDFDGGVPTRIMPTFIKLQTAIDNAYVKSAYGTHWHHSVRNTRIDHVDVKSAYSTKRRITDKDRIIDEDRIKTGLIVKVSRGSTKFEIDLTSILNNAISNMSGLETLIAILGVTSIIAGTYIWKAYINDAAKKRELEPQSQMSKEEMKMLKSINELAEKIEYLQVALKDMHKVIEELLKCLKQGDELVLGGDGILVVNGETARRLIRKKRATRIHDHLDEKFIVLPFYPGNVFSSFKVRVQRIFIKEEFNVAIPKGTLTDQQIDKLQKHALNKEPLHMRINIERVHGQIVKATLIYAGLSLDEN